MALKKIVPASNTSKEDDKFSKIKKMNDLVLALLHVM